MTERRRPLTREDFLREDEVHPEVHPLVPSEKPIDLPQPRSKLSERLTESLRAGSQKSYAERRTIAERGYPRPKKPKTDEV